MYPVCANNRTSSILTFASQTPNKGQNYMKRLVSSIFIVLALLMVAIPTASAATDKVIKVTERQVLTVLRTVGFVGGNSSVVIANGTLTVKLVIVEDGEFINAELILATAVANGQNGWWVSAMRFNGVEVSQEVIKQLGIQRPDLIAGLNDEMNNFVKIYTAKYPGFMLASISLENHIMIITMTPSGVPPAPVINAAGPQGNVLTTCTVTTTTALKLRAEPKSNGAVVTLVPIKTQLAATARQGNWLFVNFQGSTGWLSLSFLRTTGKCK
jgi:uncharacterized protein YgiM (DUF1202 family)